MKRVFYVLFTLTFLALFSTSATSIAGNSTNIIFLHHSTGGGVYWDGNVEGWFEKYNNSHGTSYKISEREYPNDPYPWENYPYDYWNLWINKKCKKGNKNVACMNELVRAHDVIIFKHCFPGAAVQKGSGKGVVSSNEKTLPNYKAQYRALRTMMDSYPDTQFIVWTLAPLHRLDTNPQDASRAAQFVKWVKKDFLTEDGKKHLNIHIFDFWGLVAETSPKPGKGKTNCLKYAYEQSHGDGDSHPNNKANKVVGPKFAECIVRAIK